MRLLTIAVLVSGVVSAQNEAIQLLRRVAETYKNLKSYRFENNYESEAKGEWQGSWSKGHTKLAVASPDRVRFETVDQMGSYAVVSDGKTIWRAVVHTREYSRSPVSGPLLAMKGGGDEAENALRRLKFAQERYWKLDENLKSAQELREETVDLEGTPVLCTVVRAEYTPPRGAEGIQAITRTFWIDKRRNLKCFHRKPVSRKAIRAHREPL